MWLWKRLTKYYTSILFLDSLSNHVIDDAALGNIYIYIKKLFAQFRVCTVLPLRHFGVYIKREIHGNRGIDFSEKQ